MTMMKKIFVSAALLFAGITASFAGDRERPITLDKLPAAAQEFLAANFKDLTLAYAVEDPKFIGSEYEVIYTDRTEVDFESNGEWSSVERKYAAVPAEVDRSCADCRLCEEELCGRVHPEDRPGQVHLGGGALERSGDQV